MLRTLGFRLALGLAAGFALHALEAPQAHAETPTDPALEDAQKRMDAAYQSMTAALKKARAGKTLEEQVAAGKAFYEALGKLETAMEDARKLPEILGERWAPTLKVISSLRKSGVVDKNGFVADRMEVSGGRITGGWDQIDMVGLNPSRTY